MSSQLTNLSFFKNILVINTCHCLAKILCKMVHTEFSNGTFVEPSLLRNVSCGILILT